MPVELSDKVIPAGALSYQKLKDSIDFVKYTDRFDRNVFLNNYLELLGNDCSSFICACHFGLEWQAGDPYMNLLNSCRLLSDLDYRIFVVNDSAAEALAHNIAAKDVQTYKLTIKLVQSGEYGTDETKKYL